MDTFQSKIYSQTALFQLSMMALIFLPAWSLNYWQAWTYLLVFFGWVYFIDFYFLKHDRALLERRLKAGAKDEKEKTQKIIQSLASICFITLFVVSGFDHHFHWSQMLIYMNVVGDAGVFLGFLIIFIVFKENSFTSSIIEIDKEQKLVDTGPYAHVRHPMYSGGILLVVFTAFALGSYWALIPSLLLGVAIVVRLLDEEKFLSINLNGYKEYIAKVRYRLVPGLW
jgi:protein-S-isoprenylcysteine O-methyltransferase Ste14